MQIFLSKLTWAFVGMAHWSSFSLVYIPGVLHLLQNYGRDPYKVDHHEEKILCISYHIELCHAPSDVQIASEQTDQKMDFYLLLWKFYASQPTIILLFIKLYVAYIYDIDKTNALYFLKIV